MSHRFVFPVVLFLFAGVLFIGACKDKSSESGSEPKVEWPEKPADGCPVSVQVLEVLKVEGGEDSQGPRARMRVFNFSEKKIERLSLSLKYKDEKGTELKSFPHTQIWPAGVEGKKHETFKGGMFMPKETKKVDVVVKKVVFAGGDAWEPSAKE